MAMAAVRAVGGPSNAAGMQKHSSSVAQCASKPRCCSRFSPASSQALQLAATRLQVSTSLISVLPLQSLVCCKAVTETSDGASGSMLV
eukprot:CAMPEP_0202913408 /NCGR_PEP_ID=MMETSP1392-20130828/60411_1 /ASSEMBLY_ACC=CAM_ASM_000868 /TAXON_ID=225041 /ORGANISM="Chlamydomonas chlamydogama, Strain SAG 11-48b" /LENGTH=87 /DNA_ID=CAMNT_0049604655 /DNA_START=343 /DNA_END=606 /DNA_ORIENTATION=+